MKRTPGRTYGSGRKFGASTSSQAQWDEGIDNPNASHAVDHSPVTYSSISADLPERSRVTKAKRPAEVDIYDFDAEEQKRLKPSKPSSKAVIDHSKNVSRRPVSILKAQAKKINAGKTSNGSPVNANKDVASPSSRKTQRTIASTESPAPSRSPRKRTIASPVKAAQSPSKAKLPQNEPTAKSPVAIHTPEKRTRTPSAKIRSAIKQTLAEPSTRSSEPVASPGKRLRTLSAATSPVVPSAAKPKSSTTPKPKDKTPTRRSLRSAQKAEVLPADTQTPAAPAEESMPTRLTTPPPLQQSVFSPNSPRLSPQQKAMYDAFGKSASGAKLDARPRRLMEALAHSKVERRQASQEDQRSHESPHKNMVEMAESNLEQQPLIAIESETQSQEAPEAMASAAESPLEQPAPSARATYSKQRTYLAEDNQIDNYINGSQARAPESSESDNDAEAQSNIRNLHDLRQSGETKRLIDDIEYLLEGLEKEKTMLATLLELSDKLISKDFSRTFRAMHYDARVLEVCKDVTHPLLLACCMLLLVACRAQDNGRDRSRKACDTELVRRALADDRDIAVLCKDRKLKVSKLNQGAVEDLRQKLSKTEAFSGAAAELAISPRILALMVCNVSSFPSQFSRTNLWPLFASLDLCSSSILLEAQLLFAAVEQSPLDVNEDIPSDSIGPLMSLGSHLLECASDPTTHVPLGSTLRALIHALQGSTPCAHLFTSQFVGKTMLVLSEKVPEAAETDDEIILCLGVLIALADGSEQGKKLIRDNSKTGMSSLLSQLSTRLNNQRMDAISGYMALLAYHLGLHLEPGADVQSIRQGLRILVDAPEINTLLSETIRAYVNAL
ncbi:hypothetical protein BCR37DRAFT_382528 [Protomyces lactucae-debilis]|uniref:Wings apart-like protein C-terminal domain-containing protein n=1 Tax=Protomyces lactucae-debilis TaxID=2754530 RepID=A0A1Y2F4J0_PROLT|nr:uncharacterized protein BCR37DRAFT_382528 [Protomyces lactucae-debilis]ORY78246.1 hypothetical protein BCR37DRAFT_382528 [Protomyces lactucae-debilis]